MSAAQNRNKNEFYQRDMVLKWRASGLSQAEFCRQEGINEWSLSQWKKREERNSDLLAVEARQAATAQRKAKRLAAKEKYWRALVQEQAASGLSIGEFCRRKGIKMNTFKRWRQHLLSAEEQVISEARVRSKGRSSNPFVQVMASDFPAEKPDPQLEIVLPCGGKIVVSEQTPMALLAKVLRILEERC